MNLQITPIKDNNINDGLIDGRLPQHPFFMSLIAPRGGGKTTFLLNLIMKKPMYYKYFHKIYIFSPTQFSDTKMMNAISIDENQRLSYYDDDVLGDIIEEQMMNNEEVEPKDRKRILFIFDDLIEELPTKRGNYFNKLASNGRHIYASVIVASQKYKKLPPIIRNNTKHWIIFDVQNNKELEDIYEEQAGKISKKAFFELFDYATTGNYNFLYIKNDAPKQERFRKNFTEIIKIS